MGTGPVSIAIRNTAQTQSNMGINSEKLVRILDEKF